MNDCAYEGKEAEPSLQFLGAAGTVTGSRYLIRTGGSLLLVDAGLFQGYKQLRLRNRAPFPVAPAQLTAVVLTHAHLDHAGYLPKLVREGFRGPIHCTEATFELSKLLLPDSGRLQEEEAVYAARKGYSRHAEPQPLYTEADAQVCLRQFRPRKFGTEFSPTRDVTAEFIPAGHLLGAAQVRLGVGRTRVHFTGDLGRQSDPLMRPPTPFVGADVLLCESTYGDREHVGNDVEADLAVIIRRVVERRGVLIVPAFAVGRAQGLMLLIARLQHRGEIPRVPIYLNSPMAIEATEIYHRFHLEHQVSVEDCRRMYELATLVRTVEESKALNTRSGPMILISASGMLTGGRVLHHVVAFGSDPRNAILLAGFQAGGTRGAALVTGTRMLRIFGREIPINAEVVSLQGLSGHADSSEILAWAKVAQAPKATYIIHGEPEAADALRSRFERELGWSARVPEHLERVSLIATQEGP